MNKREDGALKVEEEGNVEGRDFLSVKEEMVGFLEHQLDRAKNFGAFDEQSKQMRQQRIDYLLGLINSLESGHFSPAREYFAGLVEEKEEVAKHISGDLREAIATTKPRVDNFSKDRERLFGLLEEAKEESNMKRIQIILRELGSIENAIGGLAADQERIRQELRKAQDNPDLEKFTGFVAAIDEELAKTIRRV